MSTGDLSYCISITYQVCIQEWACSIWMNFQLWALFGLNIYVNEYNLTLAKPKLFCCKQFGEGINRNFIMAHWLNWSAIKLLTRSRFWLGMYSLGSLILKHKHGNSPLFSDTMESFTIWDKVTVFMRSRKIKLLFVKVNIVRKLPFL